MRYKNIGAVCNDCARKAGFVRQDRAVGVWQGECEMCHRIKWVTNLWHDWKKVIK